MFLAPYSLSGSRPDIENSTCNHEICNSTWDYEVDLFGALSNVLVSVLSPTKTNETPLVLNNDINISFVPTHSPTVTTPEANTEYKVFVVGLVGVVLAIVNIVFTIMIFTKRMHNKTYTPVQQPTPDDTKKTFV